MMAGNGLLNTVIVCDAVFVHPFASTEVIADNGFCFDSTHFVCEKKCLQLYSEVSFSFKYFISEGMYNSLYIAQD